MKKFFALTLVVAFSLLISACSDRPVAPQQVPQPIHMFVRQYFPGQTITYAEKDLEITGYKYDVFLTDGTHIDFDTDNVWDKIECNMTRTVPTALIPAPLVVNIKASFPDAMILKIDKERYGYDVELANGIELKFNKQGVLQEMDD